MLLAMTSQWEREAIGERTRDALQHKKANGQRVGTVPFGSALAADGRTLVPNLAEQEMIALIEAHLRPKLQALVDVAEADPVVVSKALNDAARAYAEIPRDL